jgi:hypothetical protein
METDYEEKESFVRKQTLEILSLMITQYNYSFVATHILGNLYVLKYKTYRRYFLIT